jgi:hypothetical protein
LNILLTYAETAVKFVESEVRYGAPNRVEDLSRVRAASDTTIWPADAPRDQSMMMARMNTPAITAFLQGPLSTSVARMQQLAAMTKTTGVGTCIGMSAVAFEYLRKKGVTGVAVIGLQGCDHALVVLGLQAAPPAAEPFLSAHGAPPSWSPAAVVCDPWYHEWFFVSEWDRKFPHILGKTLRGRPRPANVSANRIAYA